MASPPAPVSIHAVSPDDVLVKVLPGQLTVGFRENEASSYCAGHLYVAGSNERERLENLLGIAQRIRTATLDLIAQLTDDDVAQVHTALGTPPMLPVAAPLHGTTVTAVPA